MDANRLKILLIDDDEDDYLITRDLLGDIDGQQFQLDWIPEYKAALEEIDLHRHDLYLLDYRLGKCDGLQLLREALVRGCNAPIILLTGQGDREVDLEAMRAGAADFLVKSQLNPPLLERSIRYALERYRAEQKLAQLAQFDHLTGLPNRLLFQDRLSNALALAGRESRLVAVMFIDLDRFKVINDSLGHSAGDLLLQTVAARLTDSVRDSDTVARFGGDEFVVILPHIANPQDAGSVARRMLDSLAVPFLLGGHEVVSPASIGISLFPADGRDSETLIRNADAAMYQAKEGGGNACRFFAVDMNLQSLERLTLESALRNALKNQEYVLHYQPQFDMAGGRIIGLEALLRWRSPEGNLVPPGKFIPLLEETGLIIPVGDWVLRTALLQIRTWLDAGVSAPPVAVNLSAKQLQQADLVPRLQAMLGETGVSPHLLELELTESALLQKFEDAGAVLRRLKKMGIRLAIDDFGTGCSQLNHLKYFPVDRLKIDRSFVSNFGKDHGDEAIARIIIALAHSLDLTVIAEGVETEEQKRFLADHHCDGIQGFLLGRPQPAEDISRILSSAI